MPYLGASPRNINTRSVIDHQEYLGSQADTSTNSGYYTFYVNYTPGNVSVVVRGVHMASSDYTATNGTDVRISTSTITLANDDVIEIIGYGIPSSQILERSDVNITGGQAINLTQVGASSYKVGNTEVIDSSGNLISGTLGANVSFANIADDAISGDKIHSGTISSSALATTVTMSANHPAVKTALNASGDAPIYACRAWVNFGGGSSPSISQSQNISSVSWVANGHWRITFATNMPDTNYAAVGNVGSAAAHIITTKWSYSAPTSSAFSIADVNYQGTYSNTSDISIAVFR